MPLERAGRGLEASKVAVLSEIFLTAETRDWVIQTRLAYSYDTWLVLLSCLVAIFASYTAFHLVTRVSAAPTRPAKAAWLVTGAVTMGGGIWSMHFIAMLAVSLPAAMRYDVMLTGLSVVFAIIASGIAFYVVSTGVRTRARLFGGGIVLGAGIGAMHYTGMAALHMAATIRYDPLLFATSVLVAVSLSTVALRLLYHSAESSRLPKHLLKAVSGCVMGLSVAAVHYTAMTATYFLPTGSQPAAGFELDPPLIAGIIAAAAFVIAGLALTASFVDRFMEIKAREARDSESFLAAVVNNTANAIIAIGENGVIRVYNPAAERMFGYDRSEVVGENVSILLPLEERAAHDGYIRNSELSGSRILGVRRPLSGRRKDGTSIGLEISVSDMQGDEGRTFIGVCHDITERMQAERALQESERALQERVAELELAQRRLEQQGENLVRLADDLGLARDQAEAANRAKSEFLAAMSHELRTPLNAIIGFSEIIKDETFGPVGSVKYRSYAEDINESGQHLLALINDILDLSKVESGLDDLYEEDIEVPAVIESVLRLVQQRGADGGVALDLDFTDDLPLLRGDERKLKQILVNLLTNAIKFTDAGGKVTLRAWCRADSGFVFQIIDTGIGIAAEDIPKALSRFGQVDGDLNRQYEGTGLGLPLTKALVELHGGCFDLQSQVGAGTTATVRFSATRIVRSQQDAYAPVVDDRVAG